MSGSGRAIPASEYRLPGRMSGAKLCRSVMAEFNARERRSDGGVDGQRLKTCPWCRGRLVFEPFYPVMRLFPGSPAILSEGRVPEPLRTVPAWACNTPHCKFREPA